MTTTEFQNHISVLISEKFQSLEVVSEWTAFTGLSYQYSPRVDIALGPFSIEPYGNQTKEYNRLLTDGVIRKFIEEIYACHVQNIENLWQNEITIPRIDELTLMNQNARCFMAFEIENKNSRKHIMGSIVNAAALGRLGIGVAFNETVLRTFIRILNYLGFLKRVEKNTFDTTNFLVLTCEQLDDILLNG